MRDNRNESATSAIVVKGGSDNVVTDNIATGFGTIVHLEDTAGNFVSGNIQASASSPKAKPSFWFHPVTKAILYVIGVVTAAGILVYLGWKN